MCVFKNKQAFKTHYYNKILPTIQCGLLDEGLATIPYIIIEEVDEQEIYACTRHSNNYCIRWSNPAKAST